LWQIFLVIGLWFLVIGHASGVVCANAPGFGFRKPDKLDKLNFLTLLNSQPFYTEELQEKKRSFTEKSNSEKLFVYSINSVVKRNQRLRSAGFCEISAVSAGNKTG
jgi:hypothetical protein